MGWPPFFTSHTLMLSNLVASSSADELAFSPRFECSPLTCRTQPQAQLTSSDAAKISTNINAVCAVLITDALGNAGNLRCHVDLPMRVCPTDAAEAQDQVSHMTTTWTRRETSRIAARPSHHIRTPVQVCAVYCKIQLIPRTPSAAHRSPEGRLPTRQPSRVPSSGRGALCSVQSRPDNQERKDVEVLLFPC